MNKLHRVTLASVLASSLCISCSDDNESAASQTTDCGDCAANEQCLGGTCVRTTGGEPRPDASLGRDTASSARDSEPLDTVDTRPDEVDDSGDATDAAETADVGETQPDIPEIPPIAVAIDAPEMDSVFESGTVVEFIGLIGDERYTAGELSPEWSSNRDGVLAGGDVSETGRVSFSTDELSPGDHLITLTVDATDGNQGLATLQIGVCGWSETETFTDGLGLDEWRVFGDAVHDERGWLELTGNTRSRKGAIYNTGRPVLSGDIRLQLRIATGSCYEPGPCASTDGADGFAMSIFAATSEDELAAIVGAGHSGGGLGYGVSGDYGAMEVDGFHIEFDTYRNLFNGDTEFHSDPTAANHIAVTLDGDPGNHVLWTDFPTLEDNQWHQIDLEITGSHVTVDVDETTVIDDDVEGFDFKGGYIGFSGTTGYYTNYHRVDDLRVMQNCTVD